CLVLFDCDVLGIKATFERVRIDAIAHPGLFDSLPDRHDRSGTVVAEHFRKAALAGLELACSDIRVPHADAGSLEPDQNLFAPRPRNRKDVRLQNLRASIAVYRCCLHRFGNVRLHIWHLVSWCCALSSLLWCARGQFSGRASTSV